MTISYHGSFWKLLLRWKGSIWKDTWAEIIAFLVFYYSIRVVYRFALNEHDQIVFENMVILCNNHTKIVPLTFLLGFYVSAVVKRWWNQFEYLPWPDDLLSMTCFVIPGERFDARLKRQTIARYLSLATALCWRDISSPMLKRFPTTRHLVSFGLMTEEEHSVYEYTEVDSCKWFLPLQWTQKIVEVDAEIRGTPPANAAGLVRDITAFRKSLRHLYCYDWISIPLVYTQVVTIATYLYFALCLIGRQFLDPSKKIKDYEADFYIPIITIFQLIFYIGWFKVAQHLMGPFGEDDDDLELSYLLDRHIRVSFAIVDSVYDQQPKPSTGGLMAKSLFSLPHTALSMKTKLKERPPKSHVRIKVPLDSGNIDGTFYYPIADPNKDDRQWENIREF